MSANLMLFTVRDRLDATKFETSEFVPSYSSFKLLEAMKEIFIVVQFQLKPKKLVL